MRSKILRAVDEQGELPLKRRVVTSPVSPEVVKAQPSFRAAIRLAANASGMEEKEIYVPLKIDAGYWTRIMNGDANFPDDKLEQFMDLVENEIPLEWLAFRRGKGLVMLESEAQKQLRVAEARAEQAEDRLEYLEGLYRSRT